MDIVWLVAAGLVAGFIDSIAGGGGLVTLPALSLAVGPGAHAIGSNKIVGTVGSLIALAVYWKSAKVRLKDGLAFCLCVAGGSYCGSKLSPLLPVETFRWALILLCPFILYIVWNKDRWIRFEARTSAQPPFNWKQALAGVACGLYDGAFGPGGGTFMLLALLYAVHLPLWPALALSKLANSFSAGTALVTYGLAGYVHVREGGLVAIGMALGTLIGSKQALKKSSGIVRPMLAFVVSLLLLRLAWDAWTKS
jgi:uncharacterized membrane protein YfcA